jgi:serine/threonine-protein kinase
MAERGAFQAAMTPEMWERLKPFYDAALEASSERRAEILADAYRLDPEVGRELEALLANNEEPSPLDDPCMDLHKLNPPHERAFADGEVLLGRFKIVRLVGAGGMGEVYEAIDLQLGRIALKTVLADITSTPELLLRFRHEVQLARSVSNPHVCRIHELFLIDKPPGAFVTMEFLDGVTLADKLREAGPFPWREARPVALQLCAAVQSIHEAGIIHRDLKTRNIMLAERNGTPTPVLMDFGIARRLSRHTGVTSTALTRDGQIVGTPGYMAPEQYEGKQVTPATDVYSLGVVLFELVTEKLPFSKEESTTNKKTPRPSSIRAGVPRRFDEVVCKCLEYDPRRRYQSAKEVERAIRLPALLVRIQHRPYTSGALAASFLLLLSCLLLIPSVREIVLGPFPPSEKGVVFLPLEDQGGTSEAQALGDGLEESLAGELSNLDTGNRDLWVVPVSEVRERKVNTPSAALREFGATIVILGKFERNGQETRLRLTLIDPRKKREIGYVDVETKTGDLVELQHEAVTRVERLTNVSVREHPQSAGGEPETRAAYDDYLEGLGYFQRYDKPGNIDLAIKALERSVNTDPRFALGFARLGQVYILKYELTSDPKWLQQAEPYCKRAVQLNDELPLAFIALGNIHEHTGNHDLAIQEYHRAIDLDPTSPEALSAIAYSLQNANRNYEAEQAFIKSAELRPDDWFGYNALGSFYDLTGRHQEAIKQFKQALKLTPDNSAVLINLGSAYLNSGDRTMLPEAETAFKKSIQISPSFAAFTNLGWLYIVEHRYGESISASQEALKFSDQSYDVWNNLTTAYEWLARDDKADEARQKAIDILERTVKMDPRYADAQATLAALLAKQGERERAIEGVRLSLALSHSPYVLSEVADAYELLGQRRLAVKYVQEALRNGATLDQMHADPELQGVMADLAFHPST